MGGQFLVHLFIEMNFLIQATITGAFQEGLSKENLLDRLYNDEDTLNFSMEAEIEFRINEVVQTLVPDAEVSIYNTNSSVLETMPPNQYNYTIHYILTVHSSMKITQQVYKLIMKELLSEFEEMKYYINRDRIRSYTNSNLDVPDGYIDLQLIDTLEATKGNIKGRTAKAALSGLPGLPTKIINNISGYVDTMLPESAPRATPLAPELSDARLAEYNMRAVRPPSLNTIRRASAAAAVVPPPKKPWYKFWGGKRKTAHKRKNKKRRTTYKRRS